MNEDKSVRYHRLHARARVLRPLVMAAALAVFYLSGAAHGLRRLAGAADGGGQSPAAIALYAGLLAVFMALVGLPLARYAGYSLERRYGLSRESPAAWLRGYARVTVLWSAATVGLALLIYSSIGRWPHWWWLPASAAAAGLMTAATVAAPYVLLPLLLHTRPLDRTALTERLTALAAKARLPVMGVYEWKLGDRSRRINAALVGLGRLRRIILSDTLLQACTDDEIEVVLAHELGHVRHRDILAGLAAEAAVLTAGLALTALVTGTSWSVLGLAGADDPAGLPLALLCVGVAFTAARPWLNAESRRRERRADRFALALTDRPDAFISAMRKIGAANLADPDPSPLHILLFHTHPTLDERIDAARRHTLVRSGDGAAPPPGLMVSGR